MNDGSVKQMFEPLPEVGVIHGRFQILHNDHMKYLQAGKQLCNHLVVGITNPDPLLTKSEETDPSRSARTANPLTYYERYQMTRKALKEAGWMDETFSIVPFPVNRPDLYSHYVPMDATFFLTIYDAWGERKRSYFQSLGLKTHILWKAPIEKKGISGSDLRFRMRHGQPWRQFVPQAVSELVDQWDIIKRLAENT